MAGNILWQSGAVQSFGLMASGGGSAVTNTSAFQLSGILFNNGVSGGPAFYGLAEFLAAASGFGAAVSQGQTVDLYMVPSRDGNNFPNVDLTGAQMPAGSFKGSFITTVSGNNQSRMSIESIPLLPVKYQGYIVNNLGQTITSGWGITIDLYEEAYT